MAAQRISFHSLSSFHSLLYDRPFYHGPTDDGRQEPGDTNDYWICKWGGALSKVIARNTSSESNFKSLAYVDTQLTINSFSRIVYNGTITLEASSMRLYYSSLEVFKIVGTTSIAEYFWTCVWESVAQSTSGGTIYKHHNYLMADAMIFATSLPSRDYESEGLPAAVIAGVTVAVGVPMLLIFGFIAYRCQKRRPQEPSEPAISEKEKIDPVPSSTSIPYINEKC